MSPLIVFLKLRNLYQSHSHRRKCGQSSREHSHTANVGIAFLGQRAQNLGTVPVLHCGHRKLLRICKTITQRKLLQNAKTLHRWVQLVQILVRKLLWVAPKQ